LRVEHPAGADAGHEVEQVAVVVAVQLQGAVGDHAVQHALDILHRNPEPSRQIPGDKSLCPFSSDDLFHRLRELALFHVESLL
jgi:hypothetical protein